MKRALDGLKVLDLTMNLPGPFMTWLMASLGADVVKVENPSGGDYARALGGTGGTISPAFAAVNRNKKSLTLNLKTEKGRDIFHALLDDFDVVIEGFRPGTMEKLGLGYDDLAKRQPRLIMVSISGYGQDGPNRLRAGHDLNYLALAGIIGITGTKEGVPAIPGIQVADLAGGSLMAMSGFLAALYQREKTGKGQYVDISMFDGALSLSTMVYGMVAAGLETPGPGQMLLNGRLPCYGLYKTKDGGYMSLGALEYKFWQNFCAATGREDLLDKQFGGPGMEEEMAAIFADKTRAEWIDFLAEADCCCEPVLSLNEAVLSPLAAARGLVKQTEDGASFIAPPLRLSGSEAVPDEPAPELGLNTNEILEKLGFSREQLAALKDKGVI